MTMQPGSGSLPSSYREAAIKALQSQLQRLAQPVALSPSECQFLLDVVVPVILEGLRAELLSDEAIERGRQIVAYGPTAPYVAEGIRAIIEAALGL
jgi:hypothetical protein